MFTFDFTLDKIFAAILSLIFLFFGIGCAQATPDATVAEQAEAIDANLAYVDKVSEFAKENNVAWKATIKVTGRPGIGEELLMFVDTGVRTTFEIQGQPKND